QCINRAEIVILVENKDDCCGAVFTETLDDLTRRFGREFVGPHLYVAQKRALTAGFATELVDRRCEGNVLLVAVIIAVPAIGETNGHFERQSTGRYDKAAGHSNREWAERGRMQPKTRCIDDLAAQQLRKYAQAF